MRITLPPFPKLLIGALLVASAACSTDTPSAVAPNASLIATPPEPGSISATVPTQALMFMDSVRATFTIYPTVGGAAQIGNHYINFPRYTICDMSVTAYGPTEWQKTCSVSAAPVTITAVSFVDKKGHPQIDFSPALRFRVNNLGELPTLYLLDNEASLQLWSSINYCHGPNTGCTNEALTDPVLLTRRDPWSGYLYRFIRHFSGYNVWA